MYNGIFSSVQFSHSVVSDSLRPHGLQHTRLPCPSLSPGVCSKSCPLHSWCHPNISSSVTPFSSCPQSFPASGSFPMSQFFTSGGQSIGVSASASVLPMSIQDWFPLGLTGLISLQSKWLSAVKKNEIMPFAVTWMDLEIVILSEVSQTEEKYVWHPLYEEYKKKWYKGTVKTERDSQT